MSLTLGMAEECMPASHPELTPWSGLLAADVTYFPSLFR